jgi:hypothetical protein
MLTSSARRSELVSRWDFVDLSLVLGEQHAQATLVLGLCFQQVESSPSTLTACGGTSATSAAYAHEVSLTATGTYWAYQTDTSSTYMTLSGAGYYPAGQAYVSVPLPSYR